MNPIKAELHFSIWLLNNPSHLDLVTVVQLVLSLTFVLALVACNVLHT